MIFYDLFGKKKKGIIISSIFIGLVFKGFVKWYGIELDLPHYVTTQWFGVVYVIIRLTNKC